MTDENGKPVEPDSEEDTDTTEDGEAQEEKKE